MRSHHTPPGSTRVAGDDSRSRLRIAAASHIVLLRDLVAYSVQSTIPNKYLIPTGRCRFNSLRSGHLRMLATATTLVHVVGMHLGGQGESAPRRHQPVTRADLWHKPSLRTRLGLSPMIHTPQPFVWTHSVASLPPRTGCNSILGGTSHFF